MASLCKNEFFSFSVNFPFAGNCKNLFSIDNDWCVTLRRSLVYEHAALNDVEELIDQLDSFGVLDESFDYLFEQCTMHRDKIEKLRRFVRRELVKRHRVNLALVKHLKDGNLSNLYTMGASSFREFKFDAKYVNNIINILYKKYITYNQSVEAQKKRAKLVIDGNRYAVLNIEDCGFDWYEDEPEIEIVKPEPTFETRKQSRKEDWEALKREFASLSFDEDFVLVRHPGLLRRIRYIIKQFRKLRFPSFIDYRLLDRIRGRNNILNYVYNFVEEDVEEGIELANMASNVIQEEPSIYQGCSLPIESQMEDERKQVCGDEVCIHPPLNSTWNGLLTFGEQITSVKQLIRRYQPYTSLILPQTNNDPSLADVKIPLIPQGLALNLIDDYANQNREGLIPILLSGYRFYRGGMRLRIIVSDNSKNSKHIWVQHKCDENLKTLLPEISLDASLSVNRFTSGYATYVQSLSMNSIVSIEIPFYLPGQFGLLQVPNLNKKQDAPHYSLGNLYVGVDYGAKSGTQNLSAFMIVFFSAADDFRATVFQGFPPVFRLTDFETVEGQMDTEREGRDGDCDLIKEDQKENVILTAHAEESVAQPVIIGVDNWEKLCSSQAYQAYDIMQRWKNFKVLRWDKNQQQGTMLLESYLPRDFINTMLDSPNCVLFKTYAYCRFDMEIKIQVNSNVFHVGALQASFYYGSSLDAHYDDRRHVAAASQMTHCILDAATASEGVLKIPYRYYKPLLSTRRINYDDDVLNLGSFRLMVLNQLRQPMGDNSKIDVMLYIRFVEPRFHGMIDRTFGLFSSPIIEPQMFGISGLKAVVKGADQLLNQVYPDGERDNPTDPTPPVIMNPQNAQSWCVGDILPERLNVLRLQGDGVTPHPPGTIPEEPEMQLSYIQNIYGLCRTMPWTINDQEGTILLTIPFSPILGEGQYFSKTINNGAARTCEYFPPIAVLSSLFAYWRGSIDYRIDFVCSQYHTGRMLIGYVPRVSLDQTPTLEQLTNGDHIIVDIHGNKQYQFINRYLSDKPWWPRRRYDSVSTEVNPPGYIYFCVANRLTATAAVSTKIEFNLYMRGAKDFELHIPVAPHIGLSFNTEVIQRKSTSETYTATYGPPSAQIYVGDWRYISDNTPNKETVAVFRYGPTTDHVTQFMPPKADVHTVYQIVGAPDDIVFINDKKETVNANYLVLIPPIFKWSATKFWYGMAFNSLNVAKAFARSIKSDKDNPGYYILDYTKCSRSGGEGPYSTRNNVIYWESVEYSQEPTVEMITGQMDNEEPVPSTSGTQQVVQPSSDGDTRNYSWFSLSGLSNIFQKKAENLAMDVFDKKKDELRQKMMNDQEIKGFFDVMTSSMDDGRKMLLFSALSNIFHAIINPNFSTIAWSIASFFMTLGLVSIEAIYSVAAFLKKVVKRYFFSDQPRNQTANSGVVEPQGPEPNEEAAFVSTLVTGILALMKAEKRTLPKNIPDFAKWMYEGSHKFTLTANGLYIFFRNNLKMLQKMFTWVVSYFRPEAALAVELEEGDVDVIAFVHKIQWCLDASNAQLIESDPVAQLQVYTCANIAQIILAKMAVSHVEKPKPVLTRYLYKIIDLRDKLAREFKSPPLRYEPFVIGIVGPSKIGKSHLVGRLATELMKSIDYKSPDEVVYVRTPGNQFWNGLRSQPVCLYDDFLCLEDDTYGVMQIGELFSLKSTAVFNPPKAAVEEKNIRYNPLVVVLCSNEAYPKMRQVASDEAFWRRRDILIHAQCKPQYANVDPRTLPKLIKAVYGHLEFRIYKSTTKSVEGFVTKDNGEVLVMDFAELNAFLCEKHGAYFAEEANQYHNRATMQRETMPTIIDPALNIETNMQKIEEWAQRTFGVDLDKIKTSSIDGVYFGDSLDPVRKKIEAIKLTQIQKKGEIFKDPTTSVVPSAPVDADAPSAPVEPQAPAEVCRCLKEDLRMVNFVTDGENQRVVIISEKDEFDLGDCSSYCFMRETSKSIKAEACGLVIGKWKKLSYDIKKLPKSMIQFLSLDKSDKELEAVKDEVKEHLSWYQTFMKSIPSFSSILKFLGKAVVFLGAIWGIVKTMSGISNLLTNHKADKHRAEADLLWAETCHEDAAEVKTTVSKLWSEQRHTMEESVVKLFRDPSPEMPASGTSQTPGAPKGNPAVIKNFIVGQSETEIHDVVTAKVARNTFWLRAEGRNTSVNMRCIGLAGRWALVIDHYYHYICEKVHEGGTLYYICANTIIPLKLSEIEMSQAENGHSALFLVKLPKKIPAFYDLIKFFMPAHLHANLAPQAALIETKYDTKNNGVMTQVHHFARITKKDVLEIPSKIDGIKPTVVDRCYLYPKQAPGLCGSILMSLGNSQKPIIGIHVAGVRNGVTGYSEALVYESFEWIREKVRSASSDIVCQMSYDGAKMLPDTNVKFVGVIPKELEVSAPNKSRLVPTECAGEITPVNMEPPVLSSKDPRIQDDKFSPLFEGIRFHGFVPDSFPRQETWNAYVDLRDQLLAVVIPKRLEVGKLSVEQSVVGIKDIPSYEPLDLKTSEGFPFCKLRPKTATNKSWLFDIEYDEDSYPKMVGLNSDLELQMAFKERQRIEGLIPLTIFTACLKDAKLPKEKVCIPGKTRIFSISPIDFTIQQRQYFMDFSVAYQEARFKAEHAIGIDIKGCETADMLSTLLSKSNLLLTGDYSKFGDQLMSECIYYAYRIIADWYAANGDKSEENRRVRMVFCEEVMHARILAINTLYQTYCGMPSGNSLTVIINSLVNSMYTRIVWQLIMKEQDTSLYPLSKFHEYTSRLFYGDDLFMSVKQEVIDKYNVLTMSEMFSRFGIKFTDSSKKDVPVPFCSISDDSATFLKHSFYPHPFRYGMWLAKLDNVAAYEICNWTWNVENDLRASSVLACQSMMEELFGHGEEVYNAMRERVVAYWQAKNVDIKIPTWFELDIRIFGI